MSHGTFDIDVVASFNPLFRNSYIPIFGREDERGGPKQRPNNFAAMSIVIGASP